MRMRILTTLLSISVLFGARALAQEATVHHGFLFFASEKYTVDEKTFSIYADGNKFSDLIKENKKALAKFRSFETWHTTANVFTGFSLAGAAVGGFYYLLKNDLVETLGENFGMYSFIAAGGFLTLSLVFELIAWGSSSGAAEVYNRSLMDEGPALRFDPVPTPTVLVAADRAHLALTWQF